MATLTPSVPLADPTMQEDSEAQGGAAEPTLPDILDAGNPYSVVSMVSESFRRAILELPQEIEDLTEGELRDLVRPTTTEYSLRASFWREYEAAVRLGKKQVCNTDIVSGICSIAHFHNILKVPRKVAWLIRPMQTYKKEMEAILTRGNQRLWQLIDMDLLDDDGRVNVRRGELFLKAYQEVANRVKGMAIQRIREDRRSLSAHVRVNATADAPRQVPKQSVSELRKRVAELEKSKHGKALPKGPSGDVVVDVVANRAEPVSRRDGDREVVTVGVVRAEDQGSGS